MFLPDSTPDLDPVEQVQQGNEEDESSHDAARNFGSLGDLAESYKRCEHSDDAWKILLVSECCVYFK